MLLRELVLRELVVRELVLRERAYERPGWAVVTAKPAMYSGIGR